MIEEHIIKKYPELYERYKQRGGNAILKKEADDLYQELKVYRDTINIYEQECKRGLVHTAQYDGWIVEYKAKIKELEPRLKEACAAWNKSCPIYDPDNQINNCGCVVVNGTRVHWCGEHY